MAFALCNALMWLKHKADKGSLTFSLRIVEHKYRNHCMLQISGTLSESYIKNKQFARNQGKSDPYFLTFTFVTIQSCFPGSL